MLTRVIIPKLLKISKSEITKALNPPIVVKAETIIDLPILPIVATIASSLASLFSFSSKYLSITKIVNSVPMPIINAPSVAVIGVYSKPKTYINPPTPSNNQ